MLISKIELFHLRMPLKFIFKTAQTILNHRETIVIKSTDELGNAGFGEVVAFNEPFYTKETLADAGSVLVNHFIPLLMEQEIKHPFEVHRWLDSAYPMAVAGLENALLDLFARRQQQPIIDTVFSEKTNEEICAGIVLGDLEVTSLINQIAEYSQEGYTRFKIKIKPEDGFVKLKRIREKYPHLRLLADANKSFKKEHISELKKIDELGLLCLEEPLASGAMSDYQNIQEKMTTPICLDESIQTMEDFRYAIKLNACRVVNIKVGRLGGMYYVKQMIELCRRQGILFWIGSMMESGISKTLHVHLAGLKDNYIPGDLSPSGRYFDQDVIRPEITAYNGLIQVPQGPGLGVEIDEEALKYYTVNYTVFR
ncbi:MAG: o-succinylbenzoate synthase [Bacillota bacterium]|jgi:O-succinylbenzoate synthase